MNNAPTAQYIPIHESHANLNPQTYKTQLCRGQIPPKFSVNIKQSEPKPTYQDYMDQNYKRLGIDDFCGEKAKCPYGGYESKYPKGRTGGSGGVLLALSYILALLSFPLSLYFCIIIVPQFKRLAVYRNGKILNMKVQGPGVVPTLPCIDEPEQIDLRTRAHCIAPQDVITKDTMTVLIDGVIYWRVADALAAVCNIGDYSTAVQTLAGSALRNAVGTKDLSEIIKNRPGISQEIFEQMKVLTKMWGIKIIKAEIKSIRMPISVQKIMIQEAEMQKQANAKISLAQAEIETVKNLQMATLILNQNPMGMQLRYLQSLHMIAGEKTKTIVMPFSLDILRALKRLLEKQKDEPQPNDELVPSRDESQTDDEICRDALYEEVKKACSFSIPATNSSESVMEPTESQSLHDTFKKTITWNKPKSYH